MRLRYSVVTPAWNEADNLPRLAACLDAQSVRPATWVIVDTGSTDATRSVAADLAERGWARTIDSPQDVPARGAPVVRAFTAGVTALAPDLPDVIVKLDADLEFDADYFAGLLAGFQRNPRLGIASGLCYERKNGEWQPEYGTRSHVWGASRAYRVACLREVWPLEERQGWDEIDAIKARLRGWEVGTLFDVPFRHLRAEGGRDGGRRRWLDQGDTARYMGYRFSYLLGRAVFKARHEPAALAMVWGYMRAAAARAPVLPDPDARAYIRRSQRLRELPLRAREALGKTAG